MEDKKKSIKFGTQNLKAFSGSQTIEHNGKRGVFIPIEENNMKESHNGGVYYDLVSFKTNKLRPFTHNVVLSVPKEKRNGFGTVLGGWKLEDN